MYEGGSDRGSGRKKSPGGRHFDARQKDGLAKYRKDSSDRPRSDAPRENGGSSFWDEKPARFSDDSRDRGSSRPTSASQSSYFSDKSRSSQPPRTSRFSDDSRDSGTYKPSGFSDSHRDRDRDNDHHDSREPQVKYERPYRPARGEEEIPKDSLVYGIHPVEELLEHGRNRIDRIYFEQGDLGQGLFDLLKKVRHEKLPCQVVPKQRLDYMAGRDAVHQGVVVVCAARAYDDMKTLVDKGESVEAPLILVPSAIEDTRNLGAVIRSAAAFGVTGIMLEKRNSASLNAGTAKSAAGMIDHVTIVRPESLEGEIKNLKVSGYKVIGADAKATETCDKADFSGPTILITGGEHDGIPPYLKKLCTSFVKIPIEANVESLNVSAATAVLLYEVRRRKI